MLKRRNVEALLLVAVGLALAFGARRAADECLARRSRVAASGRGAPAIGPVNVLRATGDQLRAAIGRHLAEADAAAVVTRILEWRAALDPAREQHVVLASLAGSRSARAGNDQPVAPSRAETPAPLRAGTPALLAPVARASVPASPTTAPLPAPRIPAPPLAPAQYRTLRPFLVVRDPAEVRRDWFLGIACLVGAFLLAHLALRFSRLGGSQVLVPLVLLLSGTSTILLFTLTDPLRDRILYAPFVWGVVPGCVGLVLAARFVRLGELAHFKYLSVLTALALSILLVVFGTGPAGTDTRITLFGVFQPVEFVKILVVLFIAAYAAGRDLELRRLHALRVLGLSIPRWRDVLPVVVFLVAALALFFLQRDLGPALILYLVFLGLFVVASRRIALALGGMSLLVTAFWVAYRFRLLQTVSTRIDMWLNPWESQRPGGIQLAESLWALASGGFSGAGPGRSDSSYIPAGHTDLILSTAGETFGFVGVAGILTVLALIFVVALYHAWRAGSTYARYLGFGLSLLLGIQVAIIVGGTFGVLPLTGVPVPFMSYGKSAAIADLVLVGLLLNVSASHADGGPAVRTFRWWAVAIPLMVVGLLAASAWRAWDVMVTRADQVLCRGALTPQADGVRRVSYNPRIIDLTARIRRGSIVDRAGIPLATEDANELARAGPWLAELGLAVNAGAGDRRIYPLGAALVQAIGSSRGGWTSPQAIERADDRTLRGYRYDEHLVADGGVTVVERDYSALAPVFRARLAVRGGERPEMPISGATVRLTVDARLQMAAVDALARNMPVVNGTHRTKGAAVVLDPWSGDILATVSLPSYDPNAMTEADLEHVYAAEDHPAYDRARDQVYPPGSTFKLVTAAAALEERWLERPEGTTSYTCRHTNEVPWEIGGVTHRRRVTDDELETAHGTIDLRRALVESCNVYFAWLGTRLGPGPLFRVAHDRLGLALKDVAQASDLEANLPDNAYGQARITVSPIEMARVAGAIVNGGYGLDASLYLDRPKAPGARRRVLGAATAARLREWMIDVVREGTGRRAAVPGLVVGGKTGTAQSAGDASHAWFVGFAFPDGSDDHGAVAFAFLIENGGYGGQAAARAAHDFLARTFGLGPASEEEGSR